MSRLLLVIKGGYGKILISNLYDNAIEEWNREWKMPNEKQPLSKYMYTDALEQFHNVIRP